MRIHENQFLTGITAGLLFCAMAALFLSSSSALFFTASAQQRKLPPDYENKMDAIRNLEDGVVPLFILGDLNEDGAVDQKDLELLKQYVSRTSEAGITCLAAADMSRNGTVNGKDVEILERLLKRGRISAPPLEPASDLPCNFKNFWFAARRQARPGGTVPFHFLDSRFTTENSNLIVTSGQASVSRTANAFLIQISLSAAPDSMVTVSITVSGGKKYFYTVPVVPAR
jgi:Dockerin type I domain